jgi:hypothetical protein
MKVENLFELNAKTKNDHVATSIVSSLIQAITDWPKPMSTVDDFLNDVKAFLKLDTLKYDLVLSKMKHISSETFPWELESLSGLLEICELSKEVELDVILSRYEII